MNKNNYFLQQTVTFWKFMPQETEEAPVSCTLKGGYEKYVDPQPDNKRPNSLRDFRIRHVNAMRPGCQ